jgi:hypothetical protein
MGRFTPLQIVLLAFGCSLVVFAFSLDHLARAWENHRYPNAVRWHQLRIVPAKDQHIVVPGENLLVVKDADARLTLIRREPDKVRPEALIRELCRRDGCSRSVVTTQGPERAVATYRMKGTSMQIVLMRLDGGALWIEYKGSPEALARFDALIRSVSDQLAQLRLDAAG